ncbi:MAG: hypothetical protein EBS92_01445, partial [Proteobacteria bacterium]|nr:hypothetical protein [Pseudomonadota bacterium]
PKTPVSNPVIEAANEAAYKALTEAAKARSVVESLKNPTISLENNSDNNPSDNNPNNLLGLARTLVEKTGVSFNDLNAHMSALFNTLDVEPPSNKPQEGNPGQNSPTDLSKPVEISTSPPARPVEISSRPPTNTPVGPKEAEHTTQKKFSCSWTKS